MSDVTSTVLSALANTSSGGILGLIGSTVSGVVSVFQQKGQFTHDEAMAQINLQLVAAQSAATKELNAEQLRATIETQAGQAFTASQAGAAVSASTPPLIAGITALWRPILTAGLILFAVYMFPRVTADVQALIVATYIQAGAAAVLWWFGSRQIEKFMPSKPVTPPSTTTANAPAK